MEVGVAWVVDVEAEGAEEVVGAAGADGLYTSAAIAATTTTTTTATAIQRVLEAIKRGFIWYKKFEIYRAK